MEEVNQGTESSFSQQNAWVENLAIEEINMEESGVVHFNDHLNPIAHLEESSIDFMEDIKNRMESHVSRFNEFRNSHGSGAFIKMFKISNTINDFMLYRNSLRLVFSRKANDLINIGFLNNSGALVSPRTTKGLPSQGSAHEIKAHIGPFNKITWKFSGEEVNVDALIKHYLTEFVRQSAR